MVPFLYLAIKSLYCSKGRTLKKILWYDDDSIMPYFIAVGKALTYRDQRRQMMCSLEEKPFLDFQIELQKNMFFEFGSTEEHFKYRDAARKAYPHGHFPVSKDFNHMQYQIKDPKGFADMLDKIVEKNTLPEFPFLFD